MSFPRGLSPRKRGAGIHYYDEEVRGRSLPPSCRWHSPGLGMNRSTRSVPGKAPIPETCYLQAEGSVLTRAALIDVTDVDVIPVQLELIRGQYPAHFASVPQSLRPPRRPYYLIRPPLRWNAGEDL